MKIRHPWLLKFIGFVAAWLIRWWMSTLRFRIHYSEDDRHPTDVRRKRFLYAVWHETILFPTIFRTKVHILISHHADGELIAQACRHLGFKVVRGSTTRGGMQAMWELIRISRESHLMVTPDGPRGPRRRVQAGLILLASQTGLPIVPCGFAFANPWRFRSWDRFAVPRPWSRGFGVAAPAIHVPPRLSRRDRERYRELVEKQMLAATESAERWAQQPSRRTWEFRSDERRRLGA